MPTRTPEPVGVPNSESRLDFKFLIRPRCYPAVVAWLTERARAFFHSEVGDVHGMSSEDVYAELRPSEPDPSGVSLSTHERHEAHWLVFKRADACPDYTPAVGRVIRRTEWRHPFQSSQHRDALLAHWANSGVLPPGASRWPSPDQGLTTRVTQHRYQLHETVDGNGAYLSLDASRYHDDHGPLLEDYELELRLVGTTSPDEYRALLAEIASQDWHIVAHASPATPYGTKYERFQFYRSETSHLTRLQNRKALFWDHIHLQVPARELELRIIETPWFQRLRFLRQKSSGFLTYPTLTHARFEHSLGAMFLASRFLEAGLRNTAVVDPTLYREVLADLGTLFGDELGYRVVSENLLESLGVSLIRMAGLLHDIGHGPLSHLSEQALAGLERRLLSMGPRRPVPVTQPPQRLHEECGGLIVRGLADYLSSSGTPLNRVETAVLKVSGALLASKGDVAGILGCLHEVIDSDVDVDRCEFTLRDGAASGMGLQAYDLDRIVSNLQFVRHPSQGTPSPWPRTSTGPTSADHAGDASNRSGYLMRPHIKTISAIEALFFERYRTYKYVDFHHHVVFTDLAISSAVKTLLRWGLPDQESAHATSCDPVHEMKRQLGQLFPLEEFGWWHFADSGDGLVDDAWLFGRLRKAHGLLLQLGDAVLDADSRRVRALLDAVLTRRKNYRALWKTWWPYYRKNFEFTSELLLTRHCEYSGEPFPADVDARIREIGAMGLIAEKLVLLPDEMRRLGELVDEQAAKLYDGQPIFVIFDAKRFRAYEPLIPRSREPVSRYGVVVEEGRDAPAGEAIAEPYVQAVRRIRPLTEVSTLVRSLYESGQRDIRMFVYCCWDASVSVPEGDEQDVLRKAFDAFCNGLIEWYRLRGYPELLVNAGGEASRSGLQP